jgi:hypothetical protein
MAYPVYKYDDPQATVSTAIVVLMLHSEPLTKAGLLSCRHRRNPSFESKSEAHARKPLPCLHYDEALCVYLCVFPELV